MMKPASDGGDMVAEIELVTSQLSVTRVIVVVVVLRGRKKEQAVNQSIR